MRGRAPRNAPSRPADVTRGSLGEPVGKTTLAVRLAHQLADRVDAITAHHERRLAELLAAARRHPGSTPWELAGQLTWSRPWAEYGGQMRIFAVTETAAHLDLLAHRGLRHAKLEPRSGEAQMPRGSLECAESIQRQLRNIRRTSRQIRFLL